MFVQQVAALADNDAWSRCWHDEDDDETTCLHFKPISTIAPGIAFPVATERLVLGLPGPGLEYLARICRGKVPIGSVILPEQPMAPKYLCRSEGTGCSLYLDSGTVFAVCSSIVDADRASDWSSALLGLVRVFDVIVLDNLPQSSRRTIDSMRLIETDNHRLWREHKNDKQLCPHLEAPHMGEAATAAILSHCQRHNVRCVTYLVPATESYLFASVAVLAEFAPVQPNQHYSSKPQVVKQHDGLFL